MRFLILGGTVFLGRHVVDAALARGHDVTTFSRGMSGEPPDRVEWVRGDRDGGLDALGGRAWDAIVDTSGYEPRIVKQSFASLEHGHYTFVSTMNAYADVSRPGITEDEALHESDADDYGPLKAACERVVDGALIVRSGLIAGAYDPTYRFTYWADRVTSGREFLAPGPPDQPCQFIDARDEAEWIVRSAEAGLTGAFNVTGEPTTLGAVLGGGAPVVWVDPDWLLEQGVEEWTELPLWVADPDFAGFRSFDVSKAVAAGLTFRPLADTIESSLAHPGPSAGMTREREAELLAASRSRA